MLIFREIAALVCAEATRTRQSRHSSAFVGRSHARWLPTTGARARFATSWRAAVSLVRLAAHRRALVEFFAKLSGPAEAVIVVILRALRANLFTACAIAFEAIFALRVAQSAVGFFAFSACWRLRRCSIFRIGAKTDHAAPYQDNADAHG